MFALPSWQANAGVPASAAGGGRGVPDVAGNAESKSGTLIEASTYVPDLNPPVTHALAASPAYSWAPFPAAIFGSSGDAG